MRSALAVLLLSLFAAAQNEPAQALRDLPQDDQLAIVHTLKRDTRNKHLTDDRILDAKINSIDLNEDEVPEVLAQSADCGAVANCSFWILQKKGADYKVLLKAIAQKYRIRTIKTGGFADVELGRDESEYRTEWRGYKFDGKHYVKVKCWANVTGDGEREFPKPKVEPCKKR